MLQLLAAAAVAAAVPRTRPTTTATCPGLGDTSVAVSEDFIVSADEFSTISVAKRQGSELKCGLNRVSLLGQQYGPGVQYIQNSGGYFVRFYGFNATSYVQLLTVDFDDSTSNVTVKTCGEPFAAAHGISSFALSHGRSDKTATIATTQQHGVAMLTVSYLSPTTCSVTAGSPLSGNLLLNRQLTALSPDARVLALTASDSSNAQEIVIQKLKADGTADGAAYALQQLFRPSSLALRSDHSLVVINNDKLEVYDVLARPEKLLKGPLRDYESPLVLSPDGASLIAEFDGGYLTARKICPVDSDKECFPVNAKDSAGFGILQRVAFSPDGTAVALSTDVGKIVMHQLGCMQAYTPAATANQCRKCTDGDLPSPCDGIFTSDGQTCSCTKCDIRTACYETGTLSVKPSADRMTCECSCTNKFEGKRCDTCPDNFSGELCNECAFQKYPGYPNCSLTCTVQNQNCGRGAYDVDSKCRCMCGVDWTGVKCDQCDDHRAGENCTECESGYSPVDGVSGGPDPSQMVVTCSEDILRMLLPLWIVLGGGAAITAGIVAALVVRSRRRRALAAASPPYYQVPQGHPVMGVPQAQAVPVYAQPTVQHPPAKSEPQLAM
eukprot:TRINITY_DN3052_c0_g2_i3.p2 TRINITY_DN3052_c0_g2~~TRINITY_DN3052_c0_g2_i3.p2  ORF type:complete len:609 (+),score=209.65 TRINITY_DN3052_c0_g2_i3:58-1884(+)